MANLRSLAAGVSTAVEEYQSLMDNSASSGEDILTARMGVIDAAKNLLAETDDPMKRIFTISLQMAETAALRIAVEMGLLEIFPKAGNGEITLEELCERTSGEPVLMERVLRLLAALSFITQTGPRRYALSRYGEPLRNQKVQSMLVMGFDVLGLALLKMPSFLKESGYKNPRDPSDAPFQAGHQTKQSIFEFLADRPELLHHFHNALSTTGDFGMYNAVSEVPWPELIGESSEIALVDVGGADGSVLREILRRFPDIKGNFILQDLPDVIEKAPKDLDQRIKVIAHDLFSPQPVKGARAYHYRMIFHDWPFEDCRRILQNLKPAMRPGYSKLLIGDSIVPEVGATLQHCLLDLTMMTIAAEEKTESQFRQLLESEGFEITKIWRSRTAVDCLLEAELKGDGL